MGVRKPVADLVQLRKAAKTYGRPLAVLLLKRPPNERGFDALRDFRTTGTRPARPSPELLSELRRALGQREVLLELLEVSPDSLAPPSRLPELGGGVDVETVGERLREFVGVQLEAQKRTRDQGTALNLWITAVEARGILVVQTRGIGPAEMHGFSISDWPFPVIALNGSDQPRRRLFTLLHELAHLALNLGGNCDLREQRRRSSRDHADVEHRCNALAASTLLPRDALLGDAPVGAQDTWPLHVLRTLSTKYSVSSEAILLRLVGLGRASWETYWIRKPELDQAYEEAREQQRQRLQKSQGGPSYYRVKARDLGHRYARSVFDAYQSNRISSLDVASYLGIRYSQLAQLEKVVR